MVLHFHSYAPGTDVPENDRTAAMITSWSEIFSAIVTNESEFADTCFMTYQTGNFLSWVEIIDSNNSIFASNCDHVSTDFKSAEYDVWCLISDCLSGRESDILGKIIGDILLLWSDCDKFSFL